MTRSLSGAPPKPLSNSPQGERAPHNILKLSKKKLPPLGEGMGRGFRKAWGGASNNQLFLYRRKPDFLNGRRPLFEPSRWMASCTA